MVVILMLAALVCGWALGGGHCLRLSQKFDEAGERLNRFDAACLRIFAFFAPE